MRLSFVFIFFLLYSNLIAQDTEFLLSGDTLLIRANDIAAGSFNLGENPLAFLKKHNFKESFQPVENRHVDNKVDTLFLFATKADTFKIYQLEKDDFALINATVTSKNFTTKQGFHIGMKKHDVLKKLKAYGPASIPRYLILEELEFYEYLILTFTGDNLSSIGFQGYFD